PTPAQLQGAAPPGTRPTSPGRGSKGRQMRWGASKSSPTPSGQRKDTVGGQLRAQRRAFDFVGAACIEREDPQPRGANRRVHEPRFIADDFDIAGRRLQTAHEELEILPCALERSAIEAVLAPVRRRNDEVEEAVGADVEVPHLEAPKALRLEGRRIDEPGAGP